MRVAMLLDLCGEMAAVSGKKEELDPVVEEDEQQRDRVLGAAEFFKVSLRVVPLTRLKRMSQLGLQQ